MSGSYIKHITTEANTTEANLQRTRFVFSTGIITEIKLAFPPGCAGLLRVRIAKGDTVIIPSEPDSYIAWDDYVWIVPTHIVVEDELDSFEVLTWNLDQINPHTLSIAFEVSSQKLDLSGRLDVIENALFGLKIYEG